MISRLRGWATSIARRERETRIDTEVDPSALAAFLARVEDCWQRFGETEPHWSVITSPLFKAERMEETRRVLRIRRKRVAPLGGRFSALRR
jgi:hypothetical protein